MSVKFSAMAAAVLLLGGCSLAQFEHRDLKSGKKQVRSLVLMPVQVELTKVGLTRTESMNEESRQTEQSVTLLIGAVFQELGYKLDETSLSLAVLEKDPDLRYTVDDLQKKFDSELQHMQRNSRGVRKGRFTLGDEVAKLPAGENVDALLFVRVRARMLTGGKKALDYTVSHWAYDTTLMDFGIVDSKTGDILYFARPLMLTNLMTESWETAESVRLAFKNFADASPPDSTRVEAFEAPKAAYPSEARKKRIEGQVVVNMLISPKGNVDTVEVVSGDPILAKAAVEAARKWKFKPYFRNGKPVQVSLKQPMDFSLQDKEESPDVSAEVPVTREPVKPGRQSEPAVSPQATGVSNSGLQLKPVPISSRVAEGLLIKKVVPEYPGIARSSHAEGEVELRIVIDTHGLVNEVTVLSGPLQLRYAASNAVKQWRFRPYTLNGHPLEVETEIAITFAMGRP